MSVSSATAAWIATGAAVVAGLALLGALWVLLRVRGLRAGQAVLLGDGKTDLDEFDSPSGVLRFRAKSKVRRWIDSSSGQNTASMQVNLKRRIWEMRQTRGDLFADLGREPSMQEVLDATNERLAKSRSNVKRQGMICSETDYAIMIGGPAASLDDAAEVHRLTGTAGSVALHFPWDQVDDFAALLARFLTVALLCGYVVGDILRPDRDVVRRGGEDDPAGGVLAGAPDRFVLRLRRSATPAEATTVSPRPGAL